MVTIISPPTDPRTRRAEPEFGSSRKWRPRLFTIVAILGVAGTLAVTREPLAGITALFLIVVPFEKLFPRHKGQRIRRPQVLGDIGRALVASAIQILTLIVAFPVAIISLAWIPGLLLRPLVQMIPAAVAPVVGIALFDLAIYWAHRWSHEVPFLWRFHSIHHSTEQLDWASGFRNHPFDGAFIAPAFVFLLAAGFSPEFTGALTIVQIVTGIFLHANVRWRLRPFHRVIITPEFHHWHHSNHVEAHNSNYAVFLPLWDLIFGTYFMPKDRRPMVYGVDEYVPVGLVPQLVHPLRGMGNPFRVIRHPFRSTKTGFRFAVDLTGQLWRSARRPTHSLRPAGSSLQAG